MEVFEYKNEVIENPNSPQAEAYRKLELNIRINNVDKPYRVIQITSATPGDGKTTVAINLAAVYAEQGKKVLVLDFDLRRPKIHQVFHKINDIGLYDYIVNDSPIEDLIIKDENKIDMLFAGKSLSSPHIILQSKKVKNLIEILKNKYDYIVIDSPPVLTVTDALIISDLVDACIYVVSHKKTKKEEARLGLNQLIENNANVAGAVLADVNIKTNSGHYSYYYYQLEEA
ncbi:MAG: CpsD/CapB family tyrosine-protein kinase [Candidatus Izemoplasmatales bacterium]